MRRRRRLRGSAHSGHTEPYGQRKHGGVKTPPRERHAIVPALVLSLQRRTQRNSNKNRTEFDFGQKFFGTFFQESTETETKTKAPTPLPFGRGWGFIRSIYYRAKISRCSRTAGTSSRRGCARCPAGKNPAARSHCSKPRGCSPCLPSGCLQPCAAARSG